MKYRASTLPYAQNDIFEAAKWYNQHQKNLGRTFTKDVRNKIANIKQNNFAYKIALGRVRATALKIFSYMVHYTIEPSNTILIVAVLHTSPDLEIWK